MLLMQCYAPPPPGLFVPAQHRLAAAVCLISLTVLLVSLATKLRLRVGVYLERIWTSAPSTTKLFGTEP
jgi:hypothetical protein